MNWRFFILFACLSFLLYAQEKMDPRIFAKRLQTEIAACRQQADAVRKTVEEDWKRHETRVQALQKESDELLKQLEQLEDDITKLQEENQEAALQNTVAKNDEQRLAQLLPQDDSMPLSARLEQVIKDKMVLLEQLFQSPKPIPTIAKDATGKQLEGVAIHQGPLAFFFWKDNCGQLFENADGALPTVHPLKLSESQGTYFLDITGKHPELFTQPSSLLRHLRQGGVIMIPILLLGAICIIVVIIKLLQLVFHPALKDILIMEEAAAVSSSKGEALENELFTVAQQCVARREHLLFWLGVSASAAPLLGLLGTVTGMIHTFRLITFFGVGDARLLADGISEALVTTEAGLCVAIPALLCHAWLTRLAKRHATVLETKIASLVSEKRTKGT